MYNSLPPKLNDDNVALHTTLFAKLVAIQITTTNVHA